MEPIRAAGGVVTRRHEGELRVAVIHRLRYDDWTLPKGKLDPGEDWEEAAAREVQEETGWLPSLGTPAGTIRYDVGGRPKEVRYWHMEAIELRGPPDPEEVSAVHWYPVEVALRRLQYEEERRLVAALQS